MSIGCATVDDGWPATGCFPGVPFAGPVGVGA
jgi:hypothetical protein